jgi:hypothetical protein
MAEKKTISAREVVADIKVGLTDDQLMLKHGLTHTGLQSLFKKLIQARLITETDIEKRGAHKLQRPTEDRKQYIKAIVCDVKQCADDNVMKRKYGLSGRNLSDVLDKLLAAGHISKEDLARRSLVIEPLLPPLDATHENASILEDTLEIIPDHLPPNAEMVQTSVSSADTSVSEIASDHSLPQFPTPPPLPALRATDPSQIVPIYTQSASGGVVGFLKKVASSLPCTQCGGAMGLGGEATAHLPGPYKKEGLRICWACIQKLNVLCPVCNYVYNISKENTECPQCLRNTKGCELCGKILGWGDNKSSLLSAKRLTPDPGREIARICKDCLSLLKTTCDECQFVYPVTPEGSSCPNCYRLRECCHKCNAEIGSQTNYAGMLPSGATEKYAKLCEPCVYSIDIVCPACNTTYKMTKDQKDCPECERRAKSCQVCDGILQMGSGENAARHLPNDYEPQYQRICWSCLGKIDFTCPECETVYKITKPNQMCPECEIREKGCQECKKILTPTENAAPDLPEEIRSKFDRICWTCVSKLDITCPTCQTVYRITWIDRVCPECERREKGCQVCDLILEAIDNAASYLPEGIEPKYERICWTCASKLDIACPECQTHYHVTKSKHICPECERRDKGCQVCGKILEPKDNGVWHLPAGIVPAYERVCWDCLEAIPIKCDKCGATWTISSKNNRFACPKCEIRDKGCRVCEKILLPDQNAARYLPGNFKPPYDRICWECVGDLAVYCDTCGLPYKIMKNHPGCPHCEERARVVNQPLAMPPPVQAPQVIVVPSPVAPSDAGSPGITPTCNVPKKWKYTGRQQMGVCPNCKKSSIQHEIAGKAGISGAKAMAAVFTFGTSTLFTGGVSKKKTYFECKACGSVDEEEW